MVGLGVIILGGIVVDNGIVLIDYANLLQQRGMSVYDALLEASQTRLRPILMTTGTTVLGLLPLALGFGEGVELQGPMAITVMGGLLSSTFLTLVLLPTLYLIGAELLARPSHWLGTPAPRPALARAGEGMRPPEPLDASVTGMVRADHPEPAGLPEIPEDYGREDAVPAELLTALPPTLMTLGIPEPPTPAAAPPAAPPVEDQPSVLPPLLESPPPALPQSPPTLNHRQRWLLETLRAVGRMSRRDYATRQGVSIPTAARDLKGLVEAGLIRGVGPLGPGRLYELV